MGIFDWLRGKGTNPLEATGPAQVASAPTPTASHPSASLGSFRFTVQDVFSISGRGTVVTGRVESGSVAVGQTVQLERADGSRRQVEVVGVEAFRKLLDTASAGDDVGLLLRSVGREDVASGDVLRDA